MEEGIQGLKRVDQVHKYPLLKIRHSLSLSLEAYKVQNIANLITSDHVLKNDVLTKMMLSLRLPVEE